MARCLTTPSHYLNQYWLNHQQGPLAFSREKFYSNPPRMNWLQKVENYLRKIYWSQVFSGEWRCSWSSADRRCSNYIWVIKNFIAYSSTAYTRDLTVFGNTTIFPGGQWVKTGSLHLGRGMGSAGLPRQRIWRDDRYLTRSLGVDSHLNEGYIKLIVLLDWPPGISREGEGVKRGWDRWVGCRDRWKGGWMDLSHYIASLSLFYFACCIILWCICLMLFMSDNSSCSYLILSCILLRPWN